MIPMKNFDFLPKICNFSQLCRVYSIQNLSVVLRAALLCGGQNGGRGKTMKKLLLLTCCFLALCGCMRKEETPAQSGEASQPVLSMQEEQTSLEDGEGSVSEWGLTFTVRDATPTGATLVWEQSGGSPTGELETGSDFFLERLEDGEWEAVPYIDPNVAWTAEGYLVPMGETVEKAVNWEWIYGELSAGEYRVCKDFMDFRETADYDTKTLRAPFVLE